MQPYQRANEEQIRQRDAPINALKQVGSAAASLGTAYAGGAVASSLAEKVLPMLSKYIPQDLAMKGLNKIDPRLGKFVQKAMDNGESFDDAKAFIEEKAAPAAQEKKEGNIIKQYSPSLYQYIKDMIDQGNSPLNAALKAKKNLTALGAKKAIKDIEKDHKIKFEEVVESIFGQNQQAPQGQQAQSMQAPQGQQAQQGAIGNQLLEAVKEARRIRGV